MFMSVGVPSLGKLSFVHSLVDPPLIVFAATCSRCTISNFGLSTISCLLGPFRFRSLLGTTSGTHGRFRCGLLRRRDRLKGTSRMGNSSLFIGDSYEMIHVSVGGVHCVRNVDRCIHVFIRKRGGPIVALTDLRGVRRQLPTRFVHIRHSCVIGLHGVARVSHLHVVFSGGACVPINSGCGRQFARFVDGLDFSWALIVLCPVQCIIQGVAAWGWGPRGLFVTGRAFVLEDKSAPFV